MEWQPISKLPPEGSTVLGLWIPNDGKIRPDCYGTATYWPGHWCNPEDDDDDYRAPTFWMPLPEPPQ